MVAFILDESVSQNTIYVEAKHACFMLELHATIWLSPVPSCRLPGRLRQGCQRRHEERDVDDGEEEEEKEEEEK